jgi:exopolyphosphatase / guanosine-5'-triphosphate,3'-diphosphate pyrophosphatase
MTNLLIVTKSQTVSSNLPHLIFLMIHDRYMTGTPHLLAAVDMGSNSFRLVIGRVEDTPAGSQIVQVDALREPVRLAAGLDAQRYLDDESQDRGLKTLQRFGERLRHFHPERIRAVATNTLRVAKNAGDFLRVAEAALGFPIEVIAGREEARLIYLGAAHDTPTCEGHRLVIDIGGGSTEIIIGQHDTPLLLESLPIGCVSHSQMYFPNGAVSEQAFEQAELAAGREIQPLLDTYFKAGWQQIVGSSGTARALAELLELNDLNPKNTHGLSAVGLRKLRRILIRAGHMDRVRLEGLKPDRIPVLPGGLAIMLAVFEQFELEYAQTCDGALRLGVLYDLLGREGASDVRALSVARFMKRYAVDATQAKRVCETAQGLFKTCQCHSTTPTSSEEQDAHLALLAWAAYLHEMGLSISHSGHHKHAAYIATHADMPGFSRTDQDHLAALLLGHTGKLGKMVTRFSSKHDWLMLCCLRLACLLHRRRADEAMPTLQLCASHLSSDDHRELFGTFTLNIDEDWLLHHPLTLYSLEREAAEWEKIGVQFQVNAVTV